MSKDGCNKSACNSGSWEENFKTLMQEIFCKSCSTDSTDSTLTREQVAKELRELLGQSILIVLAPNQLNILNQVFRPIMCGKLVEVSNQYIKLERVNIKMSNAPEYIFPTPLIIPLVQLIWYMPFNCNTRFPLY